MTNREKDFIAIVWDFYNKNCRHDLPWRKTISTYKIIVSELMLQQTQVSRVLPKYKEFLKLFPSTQQLASAPLGDVLKAWQGLGYNRRAKFLWSAAKVVQEKYAGRWPKTFEGLKSLPGVGSYTAAAVMAFAHNEPIPLIETNVRTVYIHHFFKDAPVVADVELLPIIERTLDHVRAREWNWALMDYGSHLKITHGNAAVRSQTYKKQSSFKESNRYVRGAILRILSKGNFTKKRIFIDLKNIESEKIEMQLEKLLQEELVKKEKGIYRLP
jgi:A/G-specific adenine glycosylase